MSLVDAAQLISALAALGALIAAVAQIAGLRQDALDGRVGEILGVAVDTNVVHRPVKPDQPGGRSLWEYQFVVHNPGRSPITRVEVRIDFAIEQQRLHFDGSLDPLATHLEMFAPVVPARTSKAWTRRIVIDHIEHKLLRETVASVAFVTPDAGPYMTTWPDATLRVKGRSRLLKALRSGM